ncbi:unnamed protein product, partial [Mesorhabditis belari]|uniref:Uncharacterized protein n=1 Tax=Mesorhabditis belari TaxID=2138241 RepID=A0AAF3F6A8_9BILA
MINFTYPDSRIVKIYNFLHPGMLNLYAEQCNLNPDLMKLHPDPVKGAIYFTIGITFEFIYLLCMIAMCQPKFLNIVCYRILFAIGCFDMLGMLWNSLLPAYFLITGQSFCHSPLLNLSLGSVCLPIWAVYSGLSMSLAVNRCIDFGWPHKQQKLFGERMIILWTGAPILYGIALCIQMPAALYHPGSATYYFAVDPAHIQVPFLYTINNGLVAALILILNILMILAMFHRNFMIMTKAQRIIMFQCLAIGMSVLVTGWIYVFMQFVPTPIFMITVANVCWQLSNGSMAIVYLTVNKSMRLEVLKLLKIPFRSKIYDSNNVDSADQIQQN